MLIFVLNLDKRNRNFDFARDLIIIYLLILYV